jgi:hypothetical protein
MSRSSLDQRLLSFVTETPETATMIWRRFYALPEANPLSITTRMRRQRREVAARLEDLAADGYVKRTLIERRGVMLPGYSQHLGSDGLRLRGEW